MKPKAQKLAIPISFDTLNRNFDACIQELSGDQIIEVRMFGTSATVTLNVENLLSRIPKSARGAIIVNLTKTSGSNGNKTTANTYVYSATYLGNTVGTGLTQLAPIPNGTATAASYGLGDFNGTSGAFRLVKAFEGYGTGSC